MTIEVVGNFCVSLAALLIGWSAFLIGVEDFRIVQSWKKEHLFFGEKELSFQTSLHLSKMLSGAILVFLTVVEKIDFLNGFIFWDSTISNRLSGFLNIICLIVIFACHIGALFKWQLRWNGGSDSMFMMGVLSLGFTKLFQQLHSPLWLYPFLFWGVQTLFSYFFAGISKARVGSWWTGKSLVQFLQNASSLPARWVGERLEKRIRLAQAFGILVVIWELSWILILWRGNAVWFFIVSGVLFHFVNFILLGLNRFFWVWLASYPALIMVAAFAQANLQN